MTGVFEHKILKPTSPLVRGFDTVIHAPHSRWTEVHAEDIEKVPELELISVSDEAGVFIAKSTDSRHFFVFGHPEYDTDTLASEFHRDTKKGLNPDMPKHYFPQRRSDAEAYFQLASHSSAAIHQLAQLLCVSGNTL